MSDAEDLDELSTATLGVLGAMTSELERLRRLLPEVMPGIHTELRGHEPWLSFAHQLSRARAPSLGTSVGAIDAALSTGIHRLNTDAASLVTKLDSIRDAMRATSQTAFEGLQIAPAAIRALDSFQAARLGTLSASTTIHSLDFSRVRSSVASLLALDIDRPARALLEQIAAVSPPLNIAASPLGGTEPISPEVGAGGGSGSGPLSTPDDAHAIASSSTPIPMVEWLRQYDFLASWLSLVVALMSVLHAGDASATDRFEDTLSDLVLEVAQVERRLADQGRPRHLLKPAPLRTAPSSKSSSVCRVLPTHAVTAIFSEGRWMFVTVEDETGNRTIGWLFERHLR